MSSITIITEPKIYLVGSQLCHWSDIEKFLENHDAPDWNTDARWAGEILPEIAGRLCYMSFKSPRPGGNKAYIDHILEVGHGSVLEHAVFNFIITGVSRSFTHELVRHRAGFGFSQLSQRYVDESDVAFVVPPSLADEVIDGQHYLKCRGNDPIIALIHAEKDRITEFTRAGLQWVIEMKQALTTYQLQADYLYRKLAHIADKTTRRKMAREAARSVLPNAAETRIFVTANARALRHFIELRANAAADAEIRRVAVALLRVVQGTAPNLFGDYSIEACPLGGETASTPHRKV